MTEQIKHYVSRKDFFEKYVFTDTTPQDPVWETTARRFACAIIEKHFPNSTINEILEAFTLPKTESLEDFEKFEKLKSENEDDINLVLNLPNATKLCVFQVMADKIQTYKNGLRFYELENCYDFCSENKVESSNLELFFKELYDTQKAHAGETMLNGDICETPSYNDLITMFSSIDEKLSIDEKNRILRNNLSSKTKLINRETDIAVKNNFEFRKIPYEFFLEFGPTIREKICLYKISKEVFAVLTDAHKQLFVIKDKETCLSLYEDFKAFVKSAPRQRRNEYKGLCGTVCSLHWKGFSLFKKLPKASATDNFFKEKLLTLGFDFKNVYEQTEQVIKLVNENSNLDFAIACELTEETENKITAQGFKFTRNYMSYDFSLNSNDERLLLSFAGYPTDESYYRLTKYSFKNEKNDVFGIKIGSSRQKAEELLTSKGFEKFGRGMTNKKLSITFDSKDDVISSITISLESKYLGNRLY